jgi:hypothetical protein
MQAHRRRAAEARPAHGHVTAMVAAHITNIVILPMAYAAAEMRAWRPARGGHLRALVEAGQGLVPHQQVEGPAGLRARAFGARHAESQKLHAMRRRLCAIQ